MDTTEIRYQFRFRGKPMQKCKSSDTLYTLKQARVKAKNLKLPRSDVTIHAYQIVPGGEIPHHVLVAA